MLKKYKSLWAFKGYFIKHKKLIRKIIAVMLAASSLGMLLPYFVSERLLGIADESYEAVLRYSAVILSIIVFHHIFWFFWDKLASVLTNRIAVDIRCDLIGRFMSTRYSRLKNKTSGYYLERLNDDVAEVSSFLSNILGVIADCVTNFSFLIIVYFMNWQCGLIFTAGIALMYLIELIKIRMNLKYIEALKALDEKFNSKVNENFKAVKDIKGLGIKEQMIESTAAVSRDAADVRIRQDRQGALLSRLKTFTQHLVEAVLIVYAVGGLMPEQGISVVILLTILNYSGFMYDLVGGAAHIKDWFVRGDYKASRLLEILGEENLESFGRRETLASHGVRVQGLSYSYERSEATLKDISFTVDENRSAVFTGLSGSGKSTLFGVLSGLLQCENGRVFIGGADINDLSEKCLRDHLCIVNQEPILHNDTILNNIKIVKPEATAGEVEQACRKAHIYDEINAFENGLNTVVSENGGNISGGQKQRLSIARALLKNSDILLFDEPTSSLDKMNQELFFDTLRELKREKTILVVAHKLNDVSEFDDSFELIDGRLRRLGEA